jgi:transcriptional regulator with XRE-family HTH domain
MTADTDEIAEALLKARQTKGLSQRALSQRAGVPQGHISNIERGAVDLRLSSLVAIARALDLELALVPRKSLPAVKSIARGATLGRPIQDAAARNALNMLSRLIVSASADPNRAIDHLGMISQRVRALEALPLTHADLATLVEAGDALAESLGHANRVKARAASQRATDLLTSLRNAHMRDVAATTSLSEPPRPAYSLDEDNDA